MICKNCNADLPHDAEYCPSCGFKVFEESNSYCPRCKKIISKGDMFCKTCGYDLNNKAESSYEILNKFNFLRLKNYRLFSSIVSLVISLLLLVACFLPIFSTHNPNYSSTDLLSVLTYKELSFSSIKSINLISCLKLIINELFNDTPSYITSCLGFNVGVITYIILATFLLTFVVLSIIMIVFSIYGIIKKTCPPIIKKCSSILLSISLVLGIGAAADGIGSFMLSILPILLLIYFSIITILSKENKFNKTKFIYKVVLIAILYLIIMFLGFGTIYTYSNVSKIVGFNNNGSYHSNILSQIHLQMLFVDEEVFSFSTNFAFSSMIFVNYLVSVTSLSLASISFSQSLLSLSTPYLHIPTRKLTFGFITFTISFILCSIYCNEVNNANTVASIIKLIENEDNIKNIFYVKKTFIVTYGTYLIAFIYSIFANKNYYKGD